MTLEQDIMEKLRELPVDRQREVLDFVEFLQSKNKRNDPNASLKGIWSDLDIDLSIDDIADIRKEMWGDFPREFEE